MTDDRTQGTSLTVKNQRPKDLTPGATSSSALGEKTLCVGRGLQEFFSGHSWMPPFPTLFSSLREYLSGVENFTEVSSILILGFWQEGVRW